MNKSKIIALLSLSVLSVGVLAGGALISTNNEELTGIGAAKWEGEKCNLLFDKKVVPTLKNGSGYAIKDYVALKYENATTLNRGNAHLNKDGVIYTDATPYTLERGWGSATHGLKSITIEFIGKVNLYTAYTLKNDGQPNWQKVYKDPQTTKITYQVGEQYPPRYFKIEAVEATDIAKIDISCTGSDTVKNDTNIEQGNYVGNLHYEIYPVGNNKFDYPNKLLKVGKDEITFTKPVNAEGDLKDYTIYNCGAIDGAKGNYYVSDKDLINPDIYYLNKDNNNIYTISSKDENSYVIDSSKPIGDGNGYTIFMSGITSDIKECTSLEITKNGKPFKAPQIKLNSNATFQLGANAGENVADPIIWSVDTPNVIKVVTHNDGRDVDLIPLAKEGTYTVTATCGNFSDSIKVMIKYAFPNELINTIWKFNDLNNAKNGLIVEFDSKGSINLSSLINGKIESRGRINSTSQTFATVDTLSYASKEETGILSLTLTYINGELKVTAYTDTLNLFGNLISSKGETFEFPSLEVPQQIRGKQYRAYYTYDWDLEMDLSLLCTFNEKGELTIDFADNNNLLCSSIEETNNSCILTYKLINLDKYQPNLDKVVFEFDYPTDSEPEGKLHLIKFGDEYTITNPNDTVEIGR